MGRIAKQFWRIKGRDVIAEEIIFSLKRRPRGVDDESRQSDKNEQRLDPPNVRAHGLAKCRLGHCGFCVWHKERFPLAWQDRHATNSKSISALQKFVKRSFFCGCLLFAVMFVNDDVVHWNHAGAMLATRRL